MSEVRISLAIMHLTTNARRRAWVNDMVRQMGGPTGLNRDTEYWEITKDTHAVGPWPTAKRGWMAAWKAPKATHHVLLQDDISVCRDLIPSIKAALAEIPQAAVSLFNNRPASREAERLGKSWVALPGGVHGQGVILPSAWVSEFLTWTRANIPEDYLHDDRRLSLWIMEHKRLSLATAPSLIDHVGAAHSTLGHHDKDHVAGWYIGDDKSGIDIDWSQGALSPVVSPPRFTIDQRWADIARYIDRHSARKKEKEEQRARRSPWREF